MKKILMIFAAMAAVLSSCSKSEIDTVSNNEGKDMILNISVSNPGADTKALIKTGWAAQDSISIWYDTNVGETPDLVITYDGTKWIEKEGATVSGKTPSTGTGKYAKALYNGTVKVASKDDYTYANNTLTFDIENWKFLTEIQVVVTGLTSTSAGSYTLACDKFTPLASTGNGYTVGAEAITVATGIEGTPVTGISNTDGVAFVFATADYSTSSTDKKVFAFTLKDHTSGSVVTKVYKPNVAIAAKENKSAIKALTIESSKFDVPSPEYVVMKMGSGQSRELKWATMNLGATTVAGSYTTCYGDLYQWGSVNTLYIGFPWTSATADTYTCTWKTGKTTGGFVNANIEYTGDAATLPDANDVVKQTYPGTGWRMPTSQEFKDLADACGGTSIYNYNTSTNPGKDTPVDKGIYLCSNYDGVAGFLFCDGINKLFFPAAGCAYYAYKHPYLNAGSSGSYWSSTWLSSTNAYRAYFDSVSINPQWSGGRANGSSVRPVSD